MYVCSNEFLSYPTLTEPIMIINIVYSSIIVPPPIQPSFSGEHFIFNWFWPALTRLTPSLRRVPLSLRPESSPFQCSGYHGLFESHSKQYPVYNNHESTARYHVTTTLAGDTWFLCTLGLCTPRLSSLRTTFLLVSQRRSTNSNLLHVSNHLLRTITIPWPKRQRQRWCSGGCCSGCPN